LDRVEINECDFANACTRQFEPREASDRAASDHHGLFVQKRLGDWEAGKDIVLSRPLSQDQPGLGWPVAFSPNRAPGDQEEPPRAVLLGGVFGLFGKHDAGD